jgi:hypothetical protein
MIAKLLRLFLLTALVVPSWALGQSGGTIRSSLQTVEIPSGRIKRSTATTGTSRPQTGHLTGGSLW